VVKSRTFKRVNHVRHVPVALHDFQRFALIHPSWVHFQLNNHLK
jgi:hypothetical protein